MSTFNIHILDMYMTMYDIPLNIHTYNLYIYIIYINKFFLM